MISSDFYSTYHDMFVNYFLTYHDFMLTFINIQIEMTFLSFSFGLFSDFFNLL